MKEAGFAQVVEPSTVSNDMVYWKKGDLRITLARYQVITHSELIDRAVNSAIYNLKRHAKIEFKTLNLINEPETIYGKKDDGIPFVSEEEL